MGVDIDEVALSIAKENLIDMEMEEEIDLIRARVLPTQQKSVLDGLIGRFNTVIMSEFAAFI